MARSRRGIWAFAFVATVAGLFGVSSASGCEVSLAAALTLLPAPDRVLVPAKLPGRNLVLLVDTGADVAVLTGDIHRSVNAFGGDYATAAIRGVGGVKLVSVVDLDHLELGRLHGSGTALVTSDPLFGKDEVPFDGLLGMNLLGNFDIDFDLAGGELRLYRSRGDCDSAAAVLDPTLYSVPELPGTSRAKPPQIDVAINGETVRAMIDSGASGSMLVKRTAHRLGLIPQSVAGDRKITLHGAGSSPSPAFIHVLPPVSIGDLTISNLPVAVMRDSLEGGSELVLGMDFLSRVHVWISNSSRTVIMQFPPLPSPKLPEGS